MHPFQYNYGWPIISRASKLVTRSLYFHNVSFIYEIYCWAIWLHIQQVFYLFTWQYFSGTIYHLPSDLPAIDIIARYYQLHGYYFLGYEFILSEANLSYEAKPSATNLPNLNMSPCNDFITYFFVDKMHIFTRLSLPVRIRAQ